jgi:hypothetical protein
VPLRRTHRPSGKMRSNVSASVDDIAPTRSPCAEHAGLLAEHGCQVKPSISDDDAASASDDEHTPYKSIHASCTHLRPAPRGDVQSGLRPSRHRLPRPAGDEVDGIQICELDGSRTTYCYSTYRCHGRSHPRRRLRDSIASQVDRCRSPHSSHEPILEETPQRGPSSSPHLDPVKEVTHISKEPINAAREAPSTWL